MRPLWSWRQPAPLLLLLSLLSLVLSPGAESCTCFIVTAGASETGAAQVSYAADSHTLYGYLQVRTWARRPPLVSISLGWACQDVWAALTLGSLSSSGGVFVRACIQIKDVSAEITPQAWLHHGVLGASLGLLPHARLRNPPSGTFQEIAQLAPRVFRDEARHGPFGSVPRLRSSHTI